jgi:ABC-type Fe3+ transport system substrate-binding protein
MNWSGIAFGIIGLAIANAPTSTQAQTKWQDLPAVQKLYEAAKKEGQVMVWGTAALEVEWIPAAFSKMFPGIEVKFLGDNDVATKAIAEYRAGRHQIDVFMTSYTAGKSLLERDMYKKVDWSIFGMNPDNIIFDGRAVLTHNLLYTVIYNTRLVKPADLPKTWTDLLDPKYKDKTVASTFLLPRLIGALGLVWGEEKMLQFARDIMQTGILLTRAPPQNFLQSGERHYAVANFESQAQMWKKNGLPVDFVTIEPFIAPQFYAAVMEKAPNPNAALLLAGYLGSPEGKRDGEAHNFEGDYRRGSPHPIAQKISSSGATVVYDRMEDLARRDALTAKANSIIAGQTR